MKRAALSAALVFAACARGDPAEPIATPPRAPVESLRAVVPAPGRAFAPSLASTAGGGKIDGGWLADVETCAGCHADVAATWRTSAHAFASFNNPIYRVSVDRYRARVGDEKSRFCAGCHDVSLLVAGAMDGAIDPTDRRAHAGVTCKTCHSIERASVDGNGSYVLSTAPIPIPRADDPDSVRAHKERVRPLRSVEMCASCHRAFLGEETGNARFFAGTDDVTPWRRSAFAGSELARIDDGVARRDCRACHMEREPATRGDASAKDGTIASHRFLGGHTWLAAMRRDDDQLARVTRLLRQSASIDVAVAFDEHGGRWLPADGAPVVPDERITFDVVVKNLEVGHRFPGGTLDAQDTWIEIEVRDRTGKVLAKHGDGEDAHRLRAFVLGADGRPRFERDVDRFRAVASDTTLAPREPSVVEYAFDVPADGVATPLSVIARLRHRSRNLALQAAACADSKTERGRAFRGRTPLDPCLPQPIVDVATSEIRIGDRAIEHAPARELERLLDHGYAMMHAVQERLDEARPSLERALALAADGSPRDRARVLIALGALDGKLGRTNEALAELEAARALAPDAPAIDAAKGAAFAEVWRWGESVAPLEAAARAAPTDDGARVSLALAVASRGGDDARVLDAAVAGLAMTPRNPDLLRIQATALAGLGAPTAERDLARAAYEAHRAADDVPKIKATCSKSVPGCALERIPVHVHELTAR